MTLRTPGRWVLLGAAAVIDALVVARVATRSAGPAFDDWFFLVLSGALLIAAALWARCRVDLVVDGVRVVNGLRTHHLRSGEVTAVDVARLGDRGDTPHPTTRMRVPIGVRLEVDGGVGGTHLPVYGLAPDNRIRRDPQRWRAYLDQVDTLARHLGVPVKGVTNQP